MTGALDRRVAVVTGASRGIGKGVAVELAAAGAVVYLTGRTVNDGDSPVPGSLTGTVAEIEAAGGSAVAVRCDHHDDAQVRALLDRVYAEQRRLDVLVNNVFPAPALAAWLGTPFWQLPIEAWDEVVGIGTRAHYVATALAVPLMLERGSGLVVTVSSSGAVQYAHNVPYGVGKAAVDKMTADMAHELAGTSVSVVSLWPGLVATELVRSGARRDADGRAVLDLGAEGTFDLAEAESPRFVGRAVVALATDPEVTRRSGSVVAVADLATDYGFTDVDGRVPQVLLRPQP